MQRRFALLALAAATLAGGCATTPAPASVADTIARDPQLSTLNGLVQKAGLAETLKAAGPYTVFAPTNDAFSKMPAKVLEELQRDPARLRSVLTYHVLPGKFLAADVKPGHAKTAHGANLALAKAGTFVTVEDAMVQTADIAAGNGVIHTVDRVLLPPAR